MCPQKRPQAPLVLIVEEDVRSANVLAKLLQEDGFLVDVASDGATAIDRLARAPAPDILVTDIWLPLMDGISVARFARSVRPAIPIFLVTGYSQAISRISAHMSPPPIVMTKPVDYMELSSAMRNSVKPSERAA